MKQRRGYVYLMRSENGRYKIGVSINPEERLKQLQKQYPMIKIDLVDYHWNPNYLGWERELHDSFSEFALGREWFALPEWAVNGIKELFNEWPF